MVGQRAGIVDQAVDPRPEGPAGRLADVQRAVQGEVAVDHQEVVQRPASRPRRAQAVAELSGGGQHHVAVQGQRARRARRARRQRPVHGQVAAQAPGPAQRPRRLDQVGGRLGRLVAVDQQRAVRHLGAAGIGVGSGQDQGAQVGLAQLAGTAQDVVDGRHIGRARRRAVAHPDVGRQHVQRDLVARQPVAIDGELHAADAQGAAGVAGADRPARPGEDHEVAWAVGPVDRPVRDRPVARSGRPGSRAALDRAVVAGSRSVAVPEVDRLAGRGDQVHLVGDGGLDRARGPARQRTDVQNVVGEDAAVVDQAVDASPEGPAGRLGDVQCPVQGQVAVDHQQVVQRLAGHAGLAEAVAQRGGGVEGQVAGDRQRARIVEAARCEGSADGAAADRPGPAEGSGGGDDGPVHRPAPVRAVHQQGAGLDGGVPL